MSIHLVGGGWDPEWADAVYRGFLGEAEMRAAGAGRMVPRIGLLEVAEDEAAGREWGARYGDVLRGVASCEPVVHAVAMGQRFTSGVLTDIDGLIVAGGHTPSYLTAVEPIADEIRLLVGDGLPYLGFSAGAMIAADRAVIGGWRIDEMPVCPEDAGEDLDEVTIADGLALVDLAVDVHAAQWGTLARTVSAVEAGLVDGAVAIDESTVLVVGDDGLHVAGRGVVWQIDDGVEGVVVSTMAAQ
jgi:cyanophycinase